MDANTLLYIVTGGIAIIVAGIAISPFSPTYGNTAWMPRWMRPGVDCLERGHNYGYPGELAQIPFSRLLMFTGVSFLVGSITADSGIAGKAADGLTLLFPAYIICRTLAIRTLKVLGEASYTDAVTRPKAWKTAVAAGVPSVLFFTYVGDLLPFPMFRTGSAAYTLFVAFFLLYDLRIIYLARKSDGYITRRFCFMQMCPESCYILCFIIGSAILQPFLWTGDFRLPLAFAIVTLLFALSEYVLRFHSGPDYDRWMRTYDYLKYDRRTMPLYRAEELCRLARHGRGIFRDDGTRQWTVLVLRHPHYPDYLYVCTSDPVEESFLLEIAGEKEVTSREFATLCEAFDFRLHVMRMYEDIYCEVGRKAEWQFEDELFREECLKSDRRTGKRSCIEC